VQVGYTGIDARRMLAVRARDLLPPGEPLDPSTDESSMAQLVEAGMLSQPDADFYLHNLRNPAADKFLAFLTEELHPLLLEEFRIDADQVGLHGYSYGGLFAAWVAMQRTIFRRVGAGSPGILADVSQVLSAYDEEVANDADHSGRELHVNVCERELTASSFYQRLVGAGTVQLMARLGERPLRGLTWSSRIVPEESHATGSAISYYSYLRACWAADSPTTLLQ
jgi:predicted alpha/beta superfamily hydrolase